MYVRFIYQLLACIIILTSRGENNPDQLIFQKPADLDPHGYLKQESRVKHGKGQPFVICINP